MAPTAARDALHSQLETLASDHVLTIRLDRLEDLVVDPEVDPFRDRQGPEQAGVLDLAATLAAARHLPHDLVVRVVVPDGAQSQISPEQAQDALQRRAGYLASASWRESTAVRNMGRRQLPLGIVFYVLSAAIASGFAYLAQQAGSGVALALFTVLAALSMTIAWVISWMVVESTIFDWRPAARVTASYELLQHAKVTVVSEHAPLLAVGV